MEVSVDFMKKMKSDNKIINVKRTYYAASDGKSEDGLSEINPTNYEIVQAKQLFSGDKILFRGDKFYGEFRVRQIVVGDNLLILSSYGDHKKKGQNQF